MSNSWRIRALVDADTGSLARLAWPVVLAELGWMTMWIVDTMMVGRVSAAAIGGVSIGGHIFFTVAVFGMGMLLGLDYVVARSFGAGRMETVHRALLHSAILCVALTVVLTGLLWASIPWIADSKIEAAVLREAIPYLEAVTWGLGPLLLFTALRRYLQAMGIVKPIMVTLVTANLVNAAANWALIFGHAGFPALGAPGAGWATCLSRSYMFLSLLAYALYRDHRWRGGLLSTSLAIETKRLIELVRLGFPAALQMALEVGVFAVATALAGMLDSVAVAAHQIALSAAAFTFMVPLGVSSAAAVRVGQALGRGDVPGAQRAGWTALLIGALFMSCSAIAFVVFRHAIMRAFTPEEAVIAAGSSLLLVAAAFQLFDGTQVVATGNLRGTGDTRTAMLSNLGGHWLIGLPVGYVLCFNLGWGVTGLWIGLCAGLVCVAFLLLAAWSRRVQALQREAPVRA